MTVVTIWGPNLRTQGPTFHVHAVRCADNSKLIYQRQSVDRPFIVDIDSKQAAVEAIYEDFIFANDQDPWTDYQDDVRIFPCVTFDNEITTMKGPAMARSKNTTPKAARKPKAAKLSRDCLCGCGTSTTGTFAPGHDNRFYGQVRRGERPATDLAPFPGLMRKFEGAQREDERKAERKAAAKAEGNGDAAATVEVGADNEPAPEFTKIKVGRSNQTISSLRPLGDGRFEVNYTARNGNLRTTNVTADALS